MLRASAASAARSPGSIAVGPPIAPMRAWNAWSCAAADSSCPGALPPRGLAALSTRSRTRATLSSKTARVGSRATSAWTAAASESSRHRIESNVGSSAHPPGWVVLVDVLDDVELLDEVDVLDDVDVVVEEEDDDVVIVVDVLVELVVGGTVVLGATVVVVVGPVPVVVVTVNVVVVVGTTFSNATTKSDRVVTSPQTRSWSGSTLVVTSTKLPSAEAWNRRRSFAAAPSRFAGS